MNSPLGGAPCRTLGCSCAPELDSASLWEKGWEISSCAMELCSVCQGTVTVRCDLEVSALMGNDGMSVFPQEILAQPRVRK